MRLSSSIIHASIRSLIEQNCLRSLAHLVLYNQQNVTNHGPYRPFGENQLSPGSVGILPLTTSRPMSLQRQRVRASRRISPAFTLLMVSSPGFGSSAWYICSRLSRLLSLRLRQKIGLGCTKRKLAGSFFNRHAITPINWGSHGLSAESFRFYFIGCLTQLFTFPSRY